MPLETVNFALFSSINAAPNATQLSIHIATFIAQDLLYILAFVLFFLWFQGDQSVKKRVLKAVTLTLFGLFVSFIISSLFYHPRPFAIPLGQNYLTHTANGSFPSDHMLIFSTVAFSYLFSNRKTVGYILLGMAWLVAWARIYLGVHFPLDMCGAFIFAFLINLIGHRFWQSYNIIFFNFILNIYQNIFAKWINKGLIR